MTPRVGLGRARAGLAGFLVLAAHVGCGAASPATRPERAAATATALTSRPVDRVAAVADTGSASVVKVYNATHLLKPAARYVQGFVGALRDLFRVNPYYDYPYRVVSLPIYLFMGPFDLDDATGSGFFVDRELVVTNAHVVDNAARITVELIDGRRADAVVEALDDTRDLALLRLVGLRGAPPPPLELRRTRTRAGDACIAIGFPNRDALLDSLGLPRNRDRDVAPNPTVTLGIVSAIDVDLGNEACRYVETDAPLNPGSSGGPLLDMDGKVLGVAVMVGIDKQSEGYGVPASALAEAFPAVAWAR